MSIEELESNVLEAMHKEFTRCCTSDEINKVYRQARNWVRFHCYFGKCGEKEHSQELNHKVKEMRWDRLEFLGYETWRTRDDKR